MGNEKNCLLRDTRANVAIRFLVFLEDLTFAMLLLALALVLFLLAQKKVVQKHFFLLQTKHRVQISVHRLTGCGTSLHHCAFCLAGMSSARGCLASRAAFNVGLPARSLTSGDAAGLGQHLSLWVMPSVAFSPSTSSIALTCTQ